MAKINKPEVKSTVTASTTNTISNTVSKPTVTSSYLSGNKTNKPTSFFMFDKMNYIIMLVGLVLLTIGFFLMSGGATTDPNVFPKDEIYSARRITLAPMVILLGFCIELVAIFYKSPASSSDKETI